MIYFSKYYAICFCNIYLYVYHYGFVFHFMLLKIKTVKLNLTFFFINTRISYVIKYNEEELNLPTYSTYYSTFIVNNLIFFVYIKLLPPSFDLKYF